MPDLLTILSNSANSLYAATTMVDVAGNNMDNVNTPGYSRQRVNLAAVVPLEVVGGQFYGGGVAIQSIQQSRDTYIEAQLPSVFAQHSQYSSQASTLNGLTALNPNQTGNLTNALSAFYTAARALAQNPGDAGLRQAFVSSTQSLATAFNNTSNAIEYSRSAADSQISADVNRINTLAANMADLNRRIGMGRGAGAEPNDLLDQRQSTQDELEQLTGARPIVNGNGDISMALANGVMLVTGTTSATLSVIADVSNRGHYAVQFTHSDGSGPYDLSSSGGQLGGLMGARDGALETASTNLDSMAYDWATAVNTIHTAGFALDGSAGLDLFTGLPLTAPGAAAAIAINASILADPSLVAASSAAIRVPGDSDNLNDLVGTESTTLTTSGLAPTATLQSMVASYGASVQAAKAISDQAKALHTQLTNMRESVSGVSIDEELITMTKAQRAYQAIAHVITTTNSMLDTLMALK